MAHSTQRPAAPATWCLLTALSLALIAGGAFACRADDGIVDVTQLPRLAGAQDEPGTTPDGVSYAVPGIVPNTVGSVRKLMTDSGWMEYVRPLEDS